MISTYFFVFILWSFLGCSQSLQSGYTCGTSVTLTCPHAQKIVILEVIYSSECPSNNELINGSSMYAPSRCIGYYRERASTICNGKGSCIVDNSLDQRPSFLVGKQANCGFQGQSINIEYACIPDFTSNKLPRINICSIQSVDNFKEGFIHTPEYPLNYPNGLTCSKTIPAPASGHRLKIYALDFDVESISIARLTGLTNVNDWLEINKNGEKLYGARAPFTLLFDDVIEASLTFKSDATNSKRSYNGFLLYFIVTTVRRSRPVAATKLITTTEVDDESTSGIQQKAAGLLVDKQRGDNIGLILLVVFLSSVLAILVGAILLYKRRNDRRIRYLNETLGSLITKPSKSVRSASFNNSDPSKLSLQQESCAMSHDVKLIFKDPNENFQNSDHIYSQDPLEDKIFIQTDDANTLLYESIDYTPTNQANK